jgi:hypothetical protein
MVLRNVAPRHQLYLVAKPAHMGVDVDRLAYPQHRPTFYSHQIKRQGLQSGATMSHRAAVGGSAFSRM